MCLTIEVALVISMISVFFGVYQAVINIRRSQSHDVKADTTQMTTLIVKLESISAGIAELKNEMGCIKNDIKHDNDRLTRVEENVKSIQYRVARIEGGDSGG